MTGPCKRKQLLFKLGVFLLLGAIVNVAVAWQFALVSDPAKAYAVVMSSKELASSWWRHGPSGSRTPASSNSYRESVPGVDALTFVLVPDSDALDASVANGSVGHIRGLDSGMPYRSLRYTVEYVSGSAKTVRCSCTFPNVSNSSVITRLPLCPIWPGFAINTIFYAAIVWLLFFASGRIRRIIIVRRRISRGRCPACGYEIAEGVGPKCSECGAALPWRKCAD